MSRFFLLVPVLEVCSGGMLKDANVLVLDELLSSGSAGVYFRRLRMGVALHPEIRLEYDRRRHEYLKRVLPLVLKASDDVVIVGTHPTDVDLMQYDKVAAVRMASDGLQALSKALYGDAAVSGMEYWSVLRSVVDAVDDYHTVVSVEEILSVLVRQYPTRRMVQFDIAGHKQREVLAEVLQDVANAPVWMEDERRFDLSVTRGFLVADFDYLRMVNPVWRDAVVRHLGSAPAISSVFRLPWFAVDMRAIHSLCYRPNARGLPAVSMRGQSLVEFVKTRLASEFSPNELVGTWVGALLCDNISAVDTWRALGEAVLLGYNGSDSLVKAVAGEYTFEVPEEYLWMYAAVPDVVGIHWAGERTVDGFPLVYDGSMPTLWLASLYRGCGLDPVMRAEVVMMMYRLHVSLRGYAMASELAIHAAQLQIDGPVDGVFDPEITCYLPGYTYLMSFPTYMRLHVVAVLGCNPLVAAVVGLAHTLVGRHATLSLESTVADCARLRLLAGVAMGMRFDDMLVGAVDVSAPGFCYLELFRFELRGVIAFWLGAYPLLSRVLDARLSAYWDLNAMRSVYVTYSGQFGVVPVLHFTRSKTGVLLLDFASGLSKHYGVVTMANCMVGDDGTGTCVTQPLFVALIIGWTIVAVCLLAFLGRLIWARCVGGGGTSNRGYGGGYGRGY